MNVTFTINGTDYSDKLSTYAVTYEPEFSNVVKTLDGTEHFGSLKWRPTITFTLRPLTDSETNDLFDTIVGINTIQFTDPQKNETTTTYMRFTASVLSKFGLNSIDGNRYYKGGALTLRGISVV